MAACSLVRLSSGRYVSMVLNLVNPLAYIHASACSNSLLHVFVVHVVVLVCTGGVEVSSSFVVSTTNHVCVVPDVVVQVVVVDPLKKVCAKLAPDTLVVVVFSVVVLPVLVGVVASIVSPLPVTIIIFLVTGSMIICQPSSAIPNPNRAIIHILLTKLRFIRCFILCITINRIIKLYYYTYIYLCNTNLQEKM